MTPYEIDDSLTVADYRAPDKDEVVRFTNDLNACSVVGDVERIMDILYPTLHIWMRPISSARCN